MSVKAFRELTDNIESLSDVELNMLVIISDIIKTLKRHNKDLSQYSEVMSQLAPLVEDEIERRRKSTPGTV